MFCILVKLYLFSPLPEVTLMDANYTIDEKLGQPQKIALTSLPYSKEEMTLQFNEVHSPLQMNSCTNLIVNRLKKDFFIFRHHKW